MVTLTPVVWPAQVGCETAAKTGLVMVFGEITTTAKVDYEAIVRKTCRDIGFTSEAVGLDADTCKVGATRAYAPYALRLCSLPPRHHETLIAPYVRLHLLTWGTARSASLRRVPQPLSPNHLPGNQAGAMVVPPSAFRLP